MKLFTFLLAAAAIATGSLQASDPSEILKEIDPKTATEQMEFSQLAELIKKANPEKTSQAAVIYRPVPDIEDLETKVRHLEYRILELESNH